MREADANGGVALVTGGTRGLGAAIVEALRGAGWRVAPTWSTTPPPTADPDAVQCDVRRPAEVDRAFALVEARLGPPTAVVCNAGYAVRNLTMRTAPESFDDVVRTDLTGSFLVIRRALPAMARARTGAVVLVSSVSALWGTPGVPSYAAAKAGQIGLCRTVAREMGGRGIRANVVAPGLLDNAVERVTGGMDWIEATPLRRPGGLAEVGAVVRFLVSDLAAGVTGAVIPVDGGYALGRT